MYKLNLFYIVKRVLGERRIKFVIFFRKLLGQSIKVGQRFYYKKNFSLVIGKTGKLKIGSNVFFNKNSSINCLKKIEIGNNVMFGENVHIYDHNHKYDLGSILFKDQGYSMKSIVIGNNCWIGTNVVILQGVTIGDNVVVGANCVIYKDIPKDHVITVGQKLASKKNGTNVKSSIK